MKLAVVGVQLVLCALFFFLNDVAQGASSVHRDYCQLVFNKRDIDGVGKLSLDEVTQAAKRILTLCDRSKLQGLIKAVQKTDDGKINFSEFYKIVSILGDGTDNLNWRLIGKYGMFDKDGDGMISDTEMKGALPLLGIPDLNDNEVEFFRTQLWRRNGKKLTFLDFDGALNDLRQIVGYKKSGGAP